MYRTIHITLFDVKSLNSKSSITTAKLVNTNSMLKYNPPKREEYVAFTCINSMTFDCFTHKYSQNNRRHICEFKLGCLPGVVFVNDGLESDDCKQP